jgi:glycosyltransferase involved in cell wall biosynthesis
VAFLDPEPMTACRVLHLIESLDGGGSQRQLCHLSRALPRAGWTLHLGFARGGPELENLRDAGAILHPVEDRPEFDPRIVSDLLRLARSVRPAVIQTWMPRMDIRGGLAARLLRIPWILSERSAAGAYPAWFKREVRGSLAALASAIVSNSRGGDAYWAERLTTPPLRRIIPNGLPLEDMEQALPIVSSESGIADDVRIVLYAGRLFPDKNVPLLCEALRRILAAPGTTAVVCGEGPMREYVRDRLRDYEANRRILLTGHTSRVWAWMKRADALLSVSRHEGHPNGVLEAMACGTPLVLSDIPSHREAAGDDGALFASCDDPEAFAAAIRSVFADGEGAAARVRRARARVAGRSIETMASEYARLYAEVARLPIPEGRRDP